MPVLYFLNGGHVTFLQHYQLYFVEVFSDMTTPEITSFKGPLYIEPVFLIILFILVCYGNRKTISLKSTFRI